MTADPWHSRPAYESAGGARPVDASEDWVPTDVPTRREIEHDDWHRNHPGRDDCAPARKDGTRKCPDYQPAHDRGVVERG